METRPDFLFPFSESLYRYRSDFTVKGNWELTYKGKKLFQALSIYCRGIEYTVLTTF